MKRLNTREWRTLSLAVLFTLTAGLLVAMAPRSVPAVHAAATSSAAASTAPLLPGETLWNGVPSDMFGGDDTYNYMPGFDTNTTIQSEIKSAHVPMIRASMETVDETNGNPVPDSKNIGIAQAIQNSGATCMADLVQPVTVAQALHLVSILRPYCSIYEVYNEPDYSPAVTEPDYMTFWNSFVPQARAQFPGTYYGGPTLADEFGINDPNYMQEFLSDAASSGVAPDFVTYHWYICSGVAQSSCLSTVSSDTPTHGETISQWLATDFPGKSIPQGITEWNADSGNPSYAYDDSFMSQFEQTALTGFEQNPYLSFATEFDLASYAGYGTLDMFRLANPESSSGDYSNTPTAIGSPRPMFTTLANEIARESGGSGSPTVPAYDHVINVLLENHSYSSIVGDSTDAPYINNTLIPSGALATNYDSLVASSLPNYMALTGGTTMGWTNNCEPQPTPPNGVGPCPGGLSTGPSIASEALAAGKTWKAYEENMTSNCHNVVDGDTGGLYTIHHNPFPYYSNLSSCATNDVPYSQLSSDLGSPSTLPNYVFVTPNLNDDMHNGTIAQGDTWLSNHIPTIQNSAACQQSKCLIAITTDEGDIGSSDGAQVMTILLGPGVQAGEQDGTAYNHYSLLHTEEVALGLPTMTSNDAGAAVMANMFAAGSPPPAPTVSSFSPTSGNVGTSVTITGSAFTGATSVAFNGTNATTFTVNSDTQIHATVPTGATTGKITVTTPNGSGSSSGSFTVNTGGSATFTIVQHQATAANGTATSLAATLPSGVKLGNLLIATVDEGSNLGTISAPSGWSSAYNTLGAAQPVGSAIFYKLVDASTAGQTSWTFTLSQAHSVTASVMEVNASNGWVSTTLDKAVSHDQTATSSTALSTGTSAATTNTSDFVVANFAIHSGSQSYSGLTSGYTLLDTAVDGSSVASSDAWATTSATGTQHAAITASTAGYSVNGLAAFAAIGGAPPAPPVVSSFSPTSGPVGTSVVITGTGFTGAGSVTFNGTAVSSLTVNSDSQITTTVPSGATSGIVCVTTANGTGCSSASFTVTAPMPTISGFSPASGDVGVSVTVTGSGFSYAPVGVKFNGTAATNVTVNSDTSLTAVVPAGATTGPISVSNSAGNVVSSNSFTVTVTAACAEIVNGLEDVGTCDGVFDNPAVSGETSCVVIQNGAMVAGSCKGTFAP